MNPCERWTETLLDHADGVRVESEAAAHFSACPVCVRDLALLRRAAAALDAPSEAFNLAAPFLPPILPRRRDRWLLGIAGAGVLGVFLALHGLVDPEPWAALFASFGVLTPFSRAMFQHAGWASVLAACAGLAAAGWGLKRLLQQG